MSGVLTDWTWEFQMLKTKAYRPNSELVWGPLVTSGSPAATLCRFRELAGPGCVGSAAW